MMNINDEHREFFKDPVHKELLVEFREYRKFGQEVSFPGFVAWMEEKTGISTEPFASTEGVNVLRLGKTVRVLAEIESQENTVTDSDTLQLVRDSTQQAPEKPDTIERGYK